MNRIKFKISKVADCSLTNIGQLDFDFTLGGCNTFSFGVLLCFPANDDQACYSWVSKVIIVSILISASPFFSLLSLLKKKLIPEREKERRSGGQEWESYRDNSTWILLDFFISFDGINTNPEASSNFKHNRTALGKYRNSPFVTGHAYPKTGPPLKTEILDYQTSTWVEVEDYPFSWGGKYVSRIIEKNLLFVVLWIWGPG